MSQENVEVVLSAFADWNARDWEAWKARHHEHVVVVPPDDWPERERPVGRDAWFRQALRLIEPWEQQRLDIEAVLPDGDRVVVMHRWRASGRRSQLHLDLGIVGIFTVTDGKIARCEYYRDDAEALDALRSRGEAMSQEDAELRALAEAGYGALNAGDLDGFLALVGEDVEFTSLVAEVEGTTFRGHDGVRAWWDSVRGAFGDVRWELLEIRGSDERAVTNFRMTGTLGGVPVAQTMWQAATARDGKVRWWGFFRTESEALEAVGLRD
jgi:ketosteroid isomerase-like protein